MTAGPAATHAAAPLAVVAQATEQPIESPQMQRLLQRSRKPAIMAIQNSL